MKNILLIAVLVTIISGCCPKLTSQVTTTADTVRTTKTDTVTIVVTDTVTLAPVLIHDTINMTSFCDSLRAGLSPVIRLHARQGSVTIKSDSVGHSVVECLYYILNTVI